MSSSSGRKTSTVSFDVFKENKTPKMVLHELCIKISARVNYQVSQTTENFSCVCMVQKSNDLSTVRGEAVGANKKEAEQKAALNVLPKILSYEELFALTPAGQMLKRANVDFFKSEVEKAKTKRVDLDTDPVSDTDDDKAELNAVGELATICQRNKKLQLPEWKETEREGPKGKIFTVTCTISSIASATGRRLTKKEAKRIAAYRLSRLLIDQGYDYEKKGKGAVTQPNDKDNEEVSSSSSGSPCLVNEESKEDEKVNPRPSSIVLLEKDPSDTPVSESKTASSVDEESHEEQDKGKGHFEEDMEIDSNPLFNSTLKRKLQLEVYEHDIKRKCEQLITQQLTCNVKNKSCLKFVKDFSHIFLHLPKSQTIENKLVPLNSFQEHLREEGGPLKLLKELATEMNFKITFTKPIKLKSPELNFCVFLKVEIIYEYEFDFQRMHSFVGSGTSVQESKDKACVSALRYFRQMKLLESEL